MAVDIRELSPVPAVCVRLKRTPAALPAAFNQYLPLITQHVTALGGAISCAPFLRYHGMTDGQFDVEIGVPVAAQLDALAALAEVSGGEIGMSELPGGRAAVWVYAGPYAGLGRAWDEFNAWLTQNDLGTRGACWESYVDDPGETPPERLRTELFQQLE